jgi:hypothetical protein
VPIDLKDLISIPIFTFSVDCFAIEKLPRLGRAKMEKTRSHICFEALSSAGGHMKFAFVSFLLLLNVSCMFAPYDGQTVSPFEAINVDGFAQRPGAMVQIQAFNKRTLTWNTILTLTSATAPTTISGDTLYRFQGPLLFSSVSSWQCYWGNTSCSIPPGSASAKIRAQEVGGGQLTTFDVNGVSCVISKLNAGQGWLAAGFECRDPQSPVVTLSWIT